MACAVRRSTQPLRPRTLQVQHPATAGERAGLRRPVHPGEDAQIRRHSANTRCSRREDTISTAARTLIVAPVIGTSLYATALVILFY